MGNQNVVRMEGSELSLHEGMKNSNSIKSPLIPISATQISKRPNNDLASNDKLLGASPLMPKAFDQISQSGLSVASKQNDKEMMALKQKNQMLMAQAEMWKKQYQTVIMGS